MRIYTWLCLLFLCIPHFSFAEEFDLTSEKPLPLPNAPKAHSQTRSNTEPININTADLATLNRLPGIGKVKAQAIIDYRTQNGSFTSCEGLDKVTGIGKKTLEKIKSKCTTK